MTAAYDVLAPVHENAVRDQALVALRRDDPIQWDSKNEWWLLTRHADVREVSRNPEIFSSEPKGPWHVTEHRFSMARRPCGIATSSVARSHRAWSRC